MDASTSNRFDFMDFLAYLLPGATALVALAIPALIFMQPLDAMAIIRTLSTGTAIALVVPIATALSYVLGVLSSTLYPEAFEKKFRDQDPLEAIHPKDLEPYVKRAFEQIFGRVETWSSTHFYIARNVVSEFLPATAARAYRQGSLRQFRRNLILPIGLWWLVLSACVLASHIDWYLTTIVIFDLLVLALFICYKLFTTGVIENRKREVREILCGLPLAARKLNDK